jgi:ATP synthase protein I
VGDEAGRRKPEDLTGLGREVGDEAARKRRARKNGNGGVWLGLDMMGLVGWSVVVPTLGGAALGVWIDARHPGAHSWTLTLMGLGLTVGCLNAWQWVSRRDREMDDEEDGEDEG